MDSQENGADPASTRSRPVRITSSRVPGSRDLARSFTHPSVQQTCAGNPRVRSPKMVPSGGASVTPESGGAGDAAGPDVSSPALRQDLRAWVLSSHWRLPASGSCGRHWTRQILCRRTDPALGPAELSACPLTSPGHGAPERA